MVIYIFPWEHKAFSYKILKQQDIARNLYQVLNKENKATYSLLKV